MTAAILRRHGLRTRRLPVAAPRLVHRARAHRRRGPRARALRRRRRARGARGREGRPHAGGRRPRHPVRGAHRGRLRRAGRARASTSRSSRPASAGATTRRTCSPSRVQVLTNVGPRAHALAGPDDRRHRRARSSTSCAPAARSSSAPGCTRGRAGARRAGDRRARRAARRGARRPGRRAARRAASYQRRNFAVARAAAEAYLGELDDEAVRAAAAVDARARALRRSSTSTRRRSSTAPTTRPGWPRWPTSLRAYAAGRRVVACLSVLDDKDAAGMLRELLPVCAEVVLTAQRQPARAAGRRRSSRCAASSAARRRATVAGPAPRAGGRAPRPRGPTASSLATGSIYLIADLLRPEGARGRSML